MVLLAKNWATSCLFDSDFCSVAVIITKTFWSLLWVLWHGKQDWFEHISHWWTKLSKTSIHLNKKLSKSYSRIKTNTKILFSYQRVKTEFMPWMLTELRAPMMWYCKQCQHFLILIRLWTNWVGPPYWNGCGSNNFLTCCKLCVTRFIDEI